MSVYHSLPPPCNHTAKMGPKLAIHQTISRMQPATSAPGISQVERDVCQFDPVRRQRASSFPRLSRFAAFSFATMGASFPDRRRRLSLVIWSGWYQPTLSCSDCITWNGKKRISSRLQGQGEVRSESPVISLQRVRVEVVSSTGSQG